MTDPKDEMLAAFQRRLASDPQLRREFEASPLATMRKAGVPASPGKAERLHRQLAVGRAPAVRPSGFDPRPFDMRIAIKRRP